MNKENITYKGYTIKFLEDIKQYIFYPIGEYKENLVHKDLNYIKEYINKRIIINKENSIYRLKAKKREDIINKAIAEKEEYINLFCNTLKDNLQNEKLKHFLKNKVKKVFNLRFKPNKNLNILVGYMGLLNYENIQNLKENGYKGIYEKENKRYIAKQINGDSFFIIKKSEYVYLNFLYNLVFENDLIIENTYLKNRELIKANSLKVSEMEV